MTVNLNTHRKSIRSAISELKGKRKDLDHQIQALEGADRALSNGGSSRKPRTRSVGLPASMGNVFSDIISSLDGIDPTVGKPQRLIVEETGHNSGRISQGIRQLEDEGRVEQTNKPQRRGRKFALTAKEREARLHVTT